jgi:hypothetical protein
MTMNQITALAMDTPMAAERLMYQPSSNGNKGQAKETGG